MAESIQCYQCGTRMALAELVKNQDDCPECGAQHSLKDVAKALELNNRAQVSQGGEAVAIVCGSQVQWLPGAGKVPDRSPLYTHPADQVAEGAVVSRELLERFLSSMQDAVRFGETGKGRPPSHTCLFEIKELLQLLAKSEGIKK